MTLTKWVSRWIDLRAAALAPRTVESYRDLLRLHIAPTIGDRKLSHLKAKHISAFLADLMAAGHSRTAALCFVLLRASLRSAVQAGRLKASPCDAVTPPRHRRADPRWWTPDELHRFAVFAQNRPFALAWQLAFCCGLRRGELAGLRWVDVDQAAGLIHIRNQRQRVGGRLIDAPPKSAAGRRDLPIPPGLLPLLERQQLLQQASSILTGAAPVYVVSPNGLPIAPDRLNKELQLDVAAAGVRPINLHGLRHSMASLAVSLGVSMKVLQSILGHANYSTTANTYAHVLTADQAAAMDKIAASVV